MTRTINRKGYVKRYLRYHLREKGGAVLLAGCFLIGLALGCGCSDVLSQESWSFLISVCAPAPTDRGFWLLLGDSFASLALFVLFCFLCGFSAVGPLFAVGAVLLRGVGFGVAAVCLYSAGMGGIPWYYLLVIVPQILVWLAVALPAVGRSMRLSVSLLAALLYGQRQENAPRLGQYLTSYLFLWGGAAAGAFPCALLELLYRGFAG